MFADSSPALRSTPSGNSRHKRGFALIVTILLLAFLVIILVALASLTRVETHVATNTQDLAKARQHALMALNVAMGRLQSEAGPDQRVTGTADLVPSTHLSNRNWTGVWISDPSDPNFGTRTGWLVSGTTANATAALTGSTTSPDATSTSVVLVSSGSTDVSLDGTSATVFNRVAVPLQTMSVSSPPGTTGNTIVGRIGYWVGDEGVKAKISVYSQWPAGSAGGKSYSYDYWGGVGAGVQAMVTDVDPLATSPTFLGASFAKYKNSLGGILHLNQTPYLPYSLPSSSTTVSDSLALKTTIRTRFHDVTAHSQGLLTNVQNGGLRKDLQRILDTPGSLTTSDPEHPSQYLYPISPTAAASATYTNNPPKWGVIHDWFTQSGAMLAPRLPSDQQHGFYPTVVFYKLDIRYALSGTTATVALSPKVVIYNPYSVPFQSSDYEVGFAPIGGANVGYNIKFGTGTGSGFVNTVAFNIPRLTWTAGAAGLTDPKQWLRFKINGVVLQPGQARVYSLTSDSNYTGSNVLTQGEYTGSIIFTNPNATGTTTVETGGIAGDGAMYLAPATLPPPPPPSTTIPNGLYQFHAGYYFRVNSNQYNTPPAAINGNTAPAFIYVTSAIASNARPTTGSLGYKVTMVPWIALANIRAPIMGRALDDGGVENSSYRDGHQNYSGINNGSPSSGLVFTVNADESVSVGRDLAGSGQGMMLFDVPPTNHLGEKFLFSVADLRHVDLGRVTSESAYVTGASRAHPLVARDATSTNNTVSYFPASFFYATSYDRPYLTNKALWDQYFFSTIPRSLPANYATDANYRILPNSRYRFAPARSQVELLNYKKAAGGLVVEGGFNINSTSIEAWKAILSSRSGMTFDPQTGDLSTIELAATYSRFFKPKDNSAVAANLADGLFGGFRQLTEAQISQLAAQIVAERKRRGPSLALADFVNRKLVKRDASTGDPRFGLSGLIQSALDRTDQSPAPINVGTNGLNSLFDDSATNMPNLDAPTNQGGVTAKSSFIDYEHMYGAPVNDSNTAAPAPTTMPPRLAPRASKNANAPGMVTQGDILAAIGAHISARSDTFVIRTYGDVVNPATGEIMARAHCEAIVQRSIEYWDPSTTTYDQLPAVGSANARFGRKFNIVNFRWLTETDL